VQGTYQRGAGTRGGPVRDPLEIIQRTSGLSRATAHGGAFSRSAIVLAPRRGVRGVACWSLRGIVLGGGVSKSVAGAQMTLDEIDSNGREETADRRRGAEP